MTKDYSRDDGEPRITLRIVDIDNKKAQYAQQVCRELLLSGQTNEKMIAATLKREFDDHFGPTWHCVVGSAFGAHISHRDNHFLYFFIETFGVMIFKSV
uniref:Dynein light chain n=1 Tax=Panagrolaimus sp. JU765 TaxID=591449 RepID=A0AC34RG67_9BILA